MKCYSRKISKTYFILYILFALYCCWCTYLFFILLSVYLFEIKQSLNHAHLLAVENMHRQIYIQYIYVKNKYVHNHIHCQQKSKLKNETAICIFEAAKNLKLFTNWWHHQSLCLKSLHDICYCVVVMCPLVFL